MNQKSITRRNFIKSGVAASTLTLLPSGIYGKSSQPGNTPNNRLNIALVGVGGRGTSALRDLYDQNIVAFCDVDDARVEDSFVKAKDKSSEFAEYLNNLPNIPRFKDFRRMFDKIGNDIDAVVVSTPDHMHFPIAMWAMNLGKHVYVEKPLTRTVREARMIAEAARKHGVITQMGNQGHSMDGTRIVREWIDSGVIGEVREVQHWTNRPIWPQGMDAPDHSGFIPVVPNTLDWDLWLGIAPERPYDPSYLPFYWRGWWDFGSGAFGDMACHIMDAAYWALDLRYPTSVEAVSTAFNEYSAPNASIVTFQFPARGDKPPVKVTWSDGGLKPILPPEVEYDYEFESNGTIMIGEHATMKCGTYGGSPRIIPESKMQELRSSLPPETIPRVEGGPHKEWAKACKEGPKCGSNFDYSGPFTEVVQLGNIAIRARHKLEWDGPNMKFTNDPEANKYIGSTYEYRKGWGV